MKPDHLCLLKYTVQTGRQSKIQEVPTEIQYQNFHEEITTDYGLLLKSTGMIIPASYRQDLLK